MQYDVGPLAEKANALGEELAAALHAAEVDTRVAALIDESQRLSGAQPELCEGRGIAQRGNYVPPP